jgi:hypothetical protein
MDNTRPKVIPDTDYRYVDKSSGRVRTFRPAPDEAMVTFQGSAEEGLRAINTEPGISSISEGPDFAAVSLSPEQDMDAAQASLAAHPEVANSMAVLVDEHDQLRYFVPTSSRCNSGQMSIKPEPCRSSRIMAVRYSSSSARPVTTRWQCHRAEDYFRPFENSQSWTRWPLPNQARSA